MLSPRRRRLSRRHPGPAIKNTRFEQRTIINIENADMTNHVMFHPFLDVLAVSDGKDVGVWNPQSGSRVMSSDRPLGKTTFFSAATSKQGPRSARLGNTWTEQAWTAHHGNAMSTRVATR